MSNLNLEGRGVIVVGAGGGGIGTAIARILASEGAEITAVDRDAGALELTEQAIEEVGGRCYPRLVDAGDPGAAEEIVASAAERAAPLHGLVNVAGGLPLDHWKPLLDYSEETFDLLFRSNLKVSLQTSRVFARNLSEAGRGGSIIQIATISALQAMPYGAGYAASKAALLSFMRTMALEWGPLGIRVNAVAPGTIKVPRNASDEERDEDRAVIPLGRRGIPQDIAGAVLFLLSDLSCWITGQLLTVDGGASIRPGYLDASGLPVFVRDEEMRRRLLGD